MLLEYDSQIGQRSSFSSAVLEFNGYSQLALVVRLRFLQVSPAAQRVAESCIPPRLHEQILGLPCYVQHLLVILNRFLEVSFIVIRTTQIAVGPTFFRLFPQLDSNLKMLLVEADSLVVIGQKHVHRSNIPEFPRFAQAVTQFFLDL